MSLDEDAAWKAAAMKAARKNKTTLVSLVHPHLLKLNEDSNKYRDTEHFHPSEICKRDWCPRATSYRMLGYEQDNKASIVLQFRTLNIFAVGNQIHEKWQKWLRDVGILKGSWFCYDCHHAWEGKEKCPACNSLDTNYNEVQVYNEEHHLLGHADGIVEIPPKNAEALIEIKSIGIGTVRYENLKLFERYSNKEITAEALWGEIHHPFLTHLKQGNLYMFATGIHKMIFIYEWKAGQDVKEFEVQFQPELISDILATCAATLKSVKKKEVVDKPDWIIGRSKQPCNNCAYKKTCWEIDQ